MGVREREKRSTMVRALSNSPTCSRREMTSSVLTNGSGEGGRQLLLCMATNKSDCLQELNVVLVGHIRSHTQNAVDVMARIVAQ